MFEFAIFPDDQTIPSAIFVALEDAIDFGITRYGPDRFSIRHYRAVALEPEAEAAAAPQADRYRS